VSATEQQAERAIAVLKRWIDAAENSNQLGEDMVVCAVAGPVLAEALKALLAETELTYGTQIMDRQDQARAAIAKAEGRS
jgi:hypothetical protein